MFFLYLRQPSGAHHPAQITGRSFPDHEKVREIAEQIRTVMSAHPATQNVNLNWNDKIVSMVLQFAEADRNNPEWIKDLNIHIGNGKYVPLDQIATIHYDAEEGLIYRRDLLPMIMVQSELNPTSKFTGSDVTKQVYGSLQELRNSLPVGYFIEFDGATERSIKSSKFLAEPIPAMILSL